MCTSSLQNVQHQCQKCGTDDTKWHNADIYATIGAPVPLIQFSNTLHGHCELDIVNTVCTEHMGVESTLLTPRHLGGMFIAYTALYIVYTVHTHGRRALTLNILVGDTCLSLPLWRSNLPLWRSSLPWHRVRPRLCWFSADSTHSPFFAENFLLRRRLNCCSHSYSNSRTSLL